MEYYNISYGATLKSLNKRRFAKMYKYTYAVALCKICIGSP